MKEKKVTKKMIAWALILAMTVVGAGGFVSESVKAAETGDLVIEVTTVTGEGELHTETRTGAGLQAALSGMTYPEITSLKVLSGTLKYSDWSHLYAQSGNSEAGKTTGFSKLTSFLVEEGVRGDGVLPGGQGTNQFPQSLEMVMIPSGVIQINGYAFRDCTKLHTVILPDSVATMGRNLFEGCSSLETVTVPAGLQNIGMFAFYKCSNLSDGIILSDITSIGQSAFEGSPGPKKVVFSENITEIGEKAFYNCASLEEIVFSDGVAALDLGKDAFYGCSGLKQATLPQGMTVLPMNMFYGCKSLQTVNIPDGMITISNNAFYGCESLEELALPDSVVNIYSSAFYDCKSLKEITLPAGITDISQNLFYGCSSLEQVTFLGKVTRIREQAFMGCGFTEFTIPETVEQIGTYAFRGCVRLEKIVIPEHVTNLQTGAFFACMKLKEVTLPNGIMLNNNNGDAEVDPIFRPIFANCPIRVLNIVLKEGEENAEMITPVSVANSVFDVFYGNEVPGRALFFYKANGTQLTAETTPSLSKVASVYLAAADGDTGDDLWYGWEIGYSYSVQNRLTNLTTDNESVTWKSPEGSYTATLSGAQVGKKAYKLPESIQVTIGENEAVLGMDYTYDAETGNLVIFKEAITGNIVITAVGTLITYNVTVQSGGKGTIILESKGRRITARGNTSIEMAVDSGEDIQFWFVPDENARLESLVVDEGETTVTGENTYTISAVQGSHTVVAAFTGERLETPPPSPTEPPVPTPDVTPGITPTEPPAVTQKPTERPLQTQNPASVPTESPAPTKSPASDSNLSTIVEGLGVSEETAAKIQAAAKELDVSTDTLLVTEQTIVSQKTDEDIGGSYFARIQARASQITQNNIKLSWNRVKGADGYEVYGNRCNTKKWIYEYKKMKTIENGNKKSFIDRNCKKGTYYKYIVRAYKIIDGKKVTIAASKTIHVTTTGGKNGNAKSVDVNKKKVSLKAGKKVKLKAKEVKESKPLRHHREVSYESSDPEVATVSKKGQIKAKKKGKCTVFAYAQSGIYKKVKVTVK